MSNPQTFFPNSCEGPPNSPKATSFFLKTTQPYTPSTFERRQNEGAALWVSSDTSLAMGEVEVTQVAC